MTDETKTTEVETTTEEVAKTTVFDKIKTGAKNGAHWVSTHKSSIIKTVALVGVGVAAAAFASYASKNSDEDIDNEEPDEQPYDVKYQAEINEDGSATLTDENGNKFNLTKSEEDPDTEK